MKVYELKFDPAQGDALDFISLVDDPAIQRDFVAMSKDKLLFKADAEKQILTGPVLIPNQQIYRFNHVYGEHVVFMTKETIEQIAIDYFRKTGGQAINLQHMPLMADAFFFESWIKNGPDKIDATVPDLPDGTWIVSAKVENPELWRQVKEGEFKGFSIEGFFTREETKEEASFSEKILSVIEKLAQKIDDMFGSKSKFAVEQAGKYHKLISGEDIWISDDGQSLFTNGEVPTTPIPDGTYTLSDNSLLIVVDGKTTIKPEEVPVEEPITPPAEPAQEDNSNPINPNPMDVIKIGEVEITEPTGTIAELPAGLHSADGGVMVLVAEGGQYEVLSPFVASFIQAKATDEEKMRSALEKLQNQKPVLDDGGKSPAHQTAFNNLVSTLNKIK